MKRNQRSGIRRRTFLKAGGVSAVSMLAGCNGFSGNGGGNDGRGGSNGGSGSNGGNGGSGGGGGRITTRSSGGANSDHGLDPVFIGYLGPLSTDIGKAGYRSATLARQEVSMTGGLLGKPAVLLKGDTQSDPSRASAVVDRFIKRRGVSALIGTFRSEVALGIRDQVAKAGIPFLVTGAASPKITANTGKNDEKYKNVFRVSPVNSAFQAQALAEYGKFLNDQHGWTKFAVVAEDALWTKPITDTLPTGLTDKGLEVTMTKRFPLDTSDFTPLLDSVKKSGADVLLKAIGHANGTNLVSTWRKNEYPFANEGIDASSMNPGFWANTDGGCRYETTSGPSGVDKITSETESFVKKYKRYSTKSPTLPMPAGISSYDAVRVYVNAVKATGSSDIEQNGEAIQNWLTRTNMKGAGGHIAFYGKDEKYPNDVKYGVNREPFVVEQWKKAKNGNGLAGTDGTKVIVWPKKYATGTHVAPSWM